MFPHRNQWSANGSFALGNLKGCLGKIAVLEKGRISRSLEQQEWGMCQFCPPIILSPPPPIAFISLSDIKSNRYNLSVAERKSAGRELAGWGGVKGWGPGNGSEPGYLSREPEWGNHEARGLWGAQFYPSTNHLPNCRLWLYPRRWLFTRCQRTSHNPLV